MSYKGQVLRGEKFAVLYKESEMSGDILADYKVFLESEKKIKAAVKPKEK